ESVGLEDSTHPTEASEPSPFDDPGAPQQERPRRGRGDAPSPRSPDGKWTAFIKDHNLWLRATDGDKEIQLSQDGKEGNTYGMPRWAPDSKTLAAFRIEPGDRKEVYLIQSSPPGGGRAKMQHRSYDLPGDKLTTYELNLFQVDGPKQIKPQME